MFLLVSLLLVCNTVFEVAHCKPITISKSQYGDPTVDAALQESLLGGDLLERGSAIYTKLNVLSEQSDPLSGGSYATLPLEDVRVLVPLYTTEKGICLHPVTKNIISAGSVVFNVKTCLMCECLNGRMKCIRFTTCETIGS